MKMKHLNSMPLSLILILVFSAACTTPGPSPAVSHPSSSPEPTATSQLKDIPGTRVRLTLLYDNTTEDPRLVAEWGFSVLVGYNDHTVLFDTGPDGPSLLGNMEVLGANPEAIESVVLSHEHGDHTGGLQDLLATGIEPEIYIPAAMAGMVTEEQRDQYSVIEVSDPVEILPGMFSTGVLGRSVPEQALVVETPEGIVVITGCAHPGIVRIVQRASEIMNGEIALVIGGFHLADFNSDQIAAIIAEFRRMGVKQVTPTHCTGEDQIAQFAEAYGEDYISAGAGRVIVIGDFTP